MKKILVIDDSKFVRNFHINILQSAGFSADAAEDGIEGLEKAMTTDYDLVISDINMRNMDGLTFTRKLRETGSTIPIMIGLPILSFTLIGSLLRFLARSDIFLRFRNGLTQKNPLVLTVPI